jgi:hypothetical protein
MDPLGLVGILIAERVLGDDLAQIARQRVVLVRVFAGEERAKAAT